jgi:hypothetical protein
MCERQVSHRKNVAHNDRVSFIGRASSNDVCIGAALRAAVLGMAGVSAIRAASCARGTNVGVSESRAAPIEKTNRDEKAVSRARRVK